MVTKAVTIVGVAFEDQFVREIFGRHGYGFQFAVMNRCELLAQQGKSLWLVDGVEFPVEINGAQLHVDFLLRGKGRGLLVCETKRVEPKFGTWCFARSRFATTSRNEAERVTYEVLAHDRSQGRAFVIRDSEMPTEHQYNVALEVKKAKNDEKGESHGTTRGSWNDALTQVLRGVAGITQRLSEDVRLMAGAPERAVVPVIITTAKLLVCDCDLADSDLATGKLPDTTSISERPWLWFRHATTPQLRHHVSARFGIDHVRGFDAVADVEYVRSIGVVSIGGLQEFLGIASQHVKDRKF